MDKRNWIHWPSILNPISPADRSLLGSRLAMQKPHNSVVCGSMRVTCEIDLYAQRVNRQRQKMPTSKQKMSPLVRLGAFGDRRLLVGARAGGELTLMMPCMKTWSSKAPILNRGVILIWAATMPATTCTYTGATVLLKGHAQPCEQCDQFSVTNNGSWLSSRRSNVRQCNRLSAVG